MPEREFIEAFMSDDPSLPNAKTGQEKAMEAQMRYAEILRKKKLIGKWVIDIRPMPLTRGSRKTKYSIKSKPWALYVEPYKEE